MTIRSVSPEDAVRLTAVAHAAKRHWGYPERWIRAWQKDLTLTPDFIRDHEVFGAFEHEDLAGFYALRREGAQCIVEHFWVRPAAMGRGIGRALFEHARARAVLLGAQRLEIDADPHAEGFYVRMGARRIGDRVTRLEGRPRVLPVLVVDLNGP